MRSDHTEFLFFLWNAPHLVINITDWLVNICFAKFKLTVFKQKDKLEPIMTSNHKTTTMARYGICDRQ